MNIRRAVIEDTEQIMRLFIDTVKNVNSKDYNEKQIETWAAAGNVKEKWVKKISEQYFFVAVENELITGFASITDKGYLDYLYVHKDYQRLGTASELYKIIEQTAYKLNLTEIWVEVSITARPFFAAKGFDLTKIFTTRVNGVEFDDSIMTKQLRR